MKRLNMFLIAALVLLTLRFAASQEGGFNRVNVSLTLSGHILLGVGFEHGFDAHHALQATVFPLLVPGKGFPFAFSAGYNYYYGQNKWRGKIGAAYALLVSPPDPDKRKTMPLLVVTPGVEYRFNPTYSVLFQPWLAFFLKKANRRFAPIGLEFQYSYTY